MSNFDEDKQVCNFKVIVWECKYENKLFYSIGIYDQTQGYRNCLLACPRRPSKRKLMEHIKFFVKYYFDEKLNLIEDKN